MKPIGVTPETPDRSLRAGVTSAPLDAVGGSTHSGSVLAIVVIFKLQPLDSSSVVTLLASLAAMPPGSPQVRVVVADNTPGGQEIRQLPSAIEYKSYPDNPGLTVPYDDSLKQAKRDGFEWLLTLDQDTTLPVDFLAKMTDAARLYGAHPDVAAVVPRIVDGERTISPFRFLFGFWPSVMSPTTSGLPGRHVSALNSGSLLNVRALTELGGYDHEFSLHNSDTRLYQRLDEGGKQVAIATGVVVRHELSILDREHRISPERYRQMLLDERIFWDKHMGPAGRAERLMRLAVRFFRGWVRRENALYQQITWDELVYRMFTSRSARMGNFVRRKNLI